MIKTEAAKFSYCPLLDSAEDASFEDFKETSGSLTKD